MKSKQKKYLLISASVLVFLIILLFLLRNAGNQLVKQDQLKKADYILILMGSIPDRVLEAKDVYDAGFADSIIIVKTHQIAFNALSEKEITLPGNSELSKFALTELGIPAERIRIIPGLAQSTIDEAKSLKEFLQKRPTTESIILVTSSSHTYRASLIFERVLNENEAKIEIISAPSKYTGFNAEHWWKEKESIETVVMEWGKLVYGVLFEKS